MVENWVQTLVAFLVAAVPALVALVRQSRSTAVLVQQAAADARRDLQESEAKARHELQESEGRFRETILTRMDKLQTDIDTLRNENVNLRIKNAALDVQLGVMRAENTTLREHVARLERDLHGTN